MRKNAQKIFLFVIAALIAGIILGMQAVPNETPNGTVRTPIMSSAWSVNIEVPALDSEGRGIATEMTVETKAGFGRILTNIDKLLFWVDTQASIQTAKTVAENYTKIDTSMTDLIYSIKTDNATVVGGPSAGAALTLATIAVLEHKYPNSSVMMTGTINEDGTIGPVGGVLEKAKAAKSAGATLFLVPTGEGSETLLKPIEKCVQKTGHIYCETRYETTTLNIGESAGIDVREVSTISEAVRYFLD